MGTEYLLCKLKNGQAYNLGKPACRPPVSWTWKVTKTYLAKLKYFQPSEYAMWKIGNDSANIKPFKIKERWSITELAEIIQQSCLNEDNIDYCVIVAEGIIKWAKDDDLILFPDNLDYESIVTRFNSNKKSYRIVKTM